MKIKTFWFKSMFSLSIRYSKSKFGLAIKVCPGKEFTNLSSQSSPFKPPVSQASRDGRKLEKAVHQIIL